MTRTSRATSSQSISTLKHARTYEVALSKRGFGPVAGVDEAGRGACAGPIVIAACCLPEKPIAELAELTDSKKLSPRTRERLFPLVQRFATSYSVIVIPAAEIDECGIQHANISGMRRAVATLEERPGYVLTDAMKVPGLRCPYLPIIGGDAACRCIAAASVLAKVTRDHIMVDLSERYPEYGFEGHKGYGTAIHMDAIRRHGASAEHRMTYSNVRQAQAVFLTQSGAQPG
nr:ribonuclease HII [Corynebacterium lactis]